MTEYHDFLAVALLGCPVLGLSLAGTMYKVLQFIGSVRGTPAKNILLFRSGLILYAAQRPKYD